MKKAVLTVLIFFSILFVACSKNKDITEDLTLPMSITAHLSGNDALFTAEISETEAKIIFDPDHSLAGTVLNLSTNGNTVSCGEFKREVKSGIFPAQEAFVKALRYLTSQEVLTKSKTENGMKYTIDETAIIVYYDKNTDRLTAIETEEDGRKFHFVIISYEIQSNS